MKEIITFLDFSSESYLKLTLSTQACGKSMSVIIAISCFTKIWNSFKSSGILSSHLSSGNARCYLNALCLRSGWTALLFLDYIWGRVIFSKSEYICSRSYTLRQILPSTPNSSSRSPTLQDPETFNLFQI